jgi:hypothetical protein
MPTRPEEWIEGKILVQLGERGNPHSYRRFDNEEQAEAYLWACANCAQPDLATIVNGDGKVVWENYWMAAMYAPGVNLVRASDSELIATEIWSLDKAIIDDFPVIDEWELLEAHKILAELGWLLEVRSQVSILNEPTKPTPNKPVPIICKAVKLRLPHPQMVLAAGNLALLVEQVWQNEYSNRSNRGPLYYKVEYFPECAAGNEPSNRTAYVPIHIAESCGGKTEGERVRNAFRYWVGIDPDHIKNVYEGHYSKEGRRIQVYG